MICKDCGKECGIKVIDEGIGAYEFWGAPGFDSDPVCYSDCCEATIVDEDGDEISQNQLIRQVEEDNFDIPYDHEDY